MRMRERERKGERHKDRPEGRKEKRQEKRKIIKKKDRNKIHKTRHKKEQGKKKEKEMGSDSKGWYCVLVAMVTESQNSKSSRTANRRPHPAQPICIHLTELLVVCTHHMTKLNTEDNYLNALCRSTFLFL